MEKYQNIMKHAEYWNQRVKCETQADAVYRIEQIRRLHEYIYETAVRAEDLFIEFERLRYENQQMQQRIQQLEDKIFQIEAGDSQDE